MSLVSFIAVTFGIIGLSFAGLAFWAVFFPQFSCQKINKSTEIHDVCIRVKNHRGLHMNSNGKEF